MLFVIFEIPYVTTQIAFGGNLIGKIPMNNCKTVDFR